MKQCLIFLQKEFTEFFRSGKALTLTAVFLFFAILNPLMTQLTPWLMETLKNQFESSGIVIENMRVDAAMSWMQFFKNAPMSVIVFAFVFGGIFTTEYQTGTLVLVTTKGVKRSNILLAKTFFLLLVWTAEHWLGVAVTYVYNGIYWDNSIVDNLFVSVFAWWVFGVWVISLLVLFSTLVRTMSLLLLGVAGSVFLCYLIGIIPKLNSYLPTFLMNTPSGELVPALIVCGICSIIAVIASIPIFNKRSLC